MTLQICEERQLRSNKSVKLSQKILKCWQIVFHSCCRFKFTSQVWEYQKGHDGASPSLMDQHIHCVNDSCYGRREDGGLVLTSSNDKSKLGARLQRSVASA